MALRHAGLNSASDVVLISYICECNRDVCSALAHPQLSSTRITLADPAAHSLCWLFAKCDVQRELTSRIQHQVQGYSLDIVLQDEDETVQAIALSVIPEERLRADAERALAKRRAAQQEGPGSAGKAAADEPAALGEDDAFVRQLLSWFKRDFFTWVRHVYGDSFHEQSSPVLDIIILPVLPCSPAGPNPSSS